METVALSLGTNTEERAVHMQNMVTKLTRILHPPIVLSRLMATEPVGPGAFSAWFYNRILIGSYNASADELLACCLTIERELGRVRGAEKTDRTADIDILLFGSAVISQNHLQVPHPGLRERRFCLEGMVEIAPEMIHPLFQMTFKQLYCTMSDSVRRQKCDFLTGEN